MSAVSPAAPSPSVPSISVPPTSVQSTSVPPTSAEAVPGRFVSVPGAHNVRDLGGYTTADGRQTAWGQFLRADSLYRVPPEACAALVAQGLHTVIDLRRPEELTQEPDPFATQADVTYHGVSLFEGVDRAAIQALVAADPQGDILLALYTWALQQRGADFAKVFRLMATAPEGTQLFHCSAGKDRTGLVAALLLGLAGVSTADIVQDYALTEARMGPRIEAMVALCFQQGLDEAMVRPLLACQARTMQATLAWLAQEHGGAAGYLRAQGVSDADLEHLRERLLAPA